MKLERIATVNGLTRLACSGEVSQIRFRANDNPVEELLGPGCFGQKVLIGFDQADWIDSSGISWLIVTHKLFTAAGGIVVFHSFPSRLKTVLEFCRIDTVLHMASDEKKAAALAAKGRG